MLGPHIELHRFAALKRAAVGSLVSLRLIKSKGWDGSVWGKIAKGHFVQGLQHPRIFGRGHISRGWTNIAPKKRQRIDKLNSNLEVLASVRYLFISVYSYLYEYI
jgi:hypothetical protein